MTPTKPWHPDSNRASARLYMFRQLDAFQLVNMYNQAVGTAYAEATGDIAQGSAEISNALRMARIGLSWKPYMIDDETLRERAAINFEQALIDAFRYKSPGLVRDSNGYLAPKKASYEDVPPQVRSGELLPTQYPVP